MVTLDMVGLLINQSINKDLTSGSSPEGDVRDVPSGICNYKQFEPPEHTGKNINRRENEYKTVQVHCPRQVSLYKQT